MKKLVCTVPGMQNVPPGILIALAFTEPTTVPIIQADVEIDAMNEITMHMRTFLLSEYIA